MRFDDQAATFEQRAGLPASVCGAVAERVLELAPPGAHLLELGAGTGAIGVELLRRHPHYVALDASGPMLEQFRQRLEPAAWSKLLQADAAGPWPLPNGSVGLLLASRVLHFLPPEHVAAEAARVASADGLWLLIGRVRRDPESVRSRMRRQMRELLNDARISPRDTMLPELMQRLNALGAEPLEERRVARWEVTQAPRDALTSWSAHDGLAGVSLPPREREHILERLRASALSTFGDLDIGMTSEEEYVLSGVRLPKARSRSHD